MPGELFEWLRIPCLPRMTYIQALSWKCGDWNDPVVDIAFVKLKNTVVERKQRVIGLTARMAIFFIFQL